VRVLVIPEDDRKDADLLEPLVRAMMAYAGWPQAKVIVCSNPRLGGVDQALRWERIAEIIDRWKGMTELFLLIIDRDAKEGRRVSLDGIEQRSRGELPNNKVFLAEHAIEEVEVWVLAGHELPSEWTWREIRKDPHPKERYFVPFLTQRKLSDDVPGRRMLAKEAARNFQRICDRCPEDVRRLADQIRRTKSDKS
jgi:hypothetical protein